MSNVIPSRIILFLKQFPPFNLLDDEDLKLLAEQTVVCFHRPGEYVFKQGETPKDCIYVVHEGAVHLVSNEEGEELLVESCDEGDLFGLRPLLAEQEYKLSAKVAEESLLYAIKVKGLKELLVERPKLSLYLAQSFAAGIQARVEAISGAKNPDPSSIIEESEQLIGVYKLEPKKRPVTCLPENTIMDASKIMRQQNVGSIIIVNGQQFPVGIVTDKDLRNKVATGDFDLQRSIQDIMSAPVITYPPGVTIAEVQMAMVKNRIHHLVLTEDGTTESPIKGVVSEHDLMVHQGNNPAILVRRIHRSTSADELRDIRAKAEELLMKYLEQEVAIDFIADVMSEINDGIIRRCVQLSEYEMQGEGLTKPNVSYCWLSPGSEGRQEQLLRTDQDNALVFTDVSEEEEPAVKAYFLKLAEKATDLLNQVGFEYCPADMMARNPSWCLSLSDWKKQFSSWIHTPTEKNVMFLTIFLDFRAVYGDASLSEALAEHIFENIDDRTQFLSFLAKNALENPPPLTFFRNFMAEKSGEHKNAFDIKARAMMPLADAARVLILSQRKPRINNTFRRFEFMIEAEPANAELFQQAADAYELFMRYRAMQGLKNKDSGRYFDPAQLTKMQRLSLRNGFEPIRELQFILKRRYRLDLFM